MTPYRNKIAKHSFATLGVVYVLFGTLTLLCIQARISRVMPQEGPLQYLASATKMVHNRVVWNAHCEQVESDEVVATSLVASSFPEEVSIQLPALSVLTVTQRSTSCRLYFLRPPPPHV